MSPIRSPEKMLKERSSNNVRFPNDLLTFWQLRNNVIALCYHNWGKVSKRLLTASIPKTKIKEVVMAVKDSNGTELNNGDSVTVIKDLKVKGASMTLKRGTLYKDIRLTDSDEEVECGKGRNTIVLKTCFLKKA
jgi:protein PhnA